MKHARSRRLLLACLLAGLASAASAQVAVSATAEPFDLAAADAANDARNQPLCLQETGTRIHRMRAPTSNAAPPRATDCATSQPGRSFSRRDIERTGAFNVADALRQLDPSIH